MYEYVAKWINLPEIFDWMSWNKSCEGEEVLDKTFGAQIQTLQEALSSYHRLTTGRSYLLYQKLFEDVGVGCTPDQ